MKSLTLETRTLLFNLKKHADRFNAACEKINPNVGGNETLVGVDAAIDEWNVLINSAVKALKKAKLEMISQPTDPIFTAGDIS